MAYKLITPLNSVNNKPLTKAVSLVTTTGQLLQFSLTTGLLASSAAATDQNTILWISNETIAAASGSFAGLTAVLGTEVRDGDEYLVDTVNNSASAHNGQRMVIDATGLLLNNTGTDAPAGVFEQVDVVGAAIDKKVRARKVG